MQNSTKKPACLNFYPRPPRGGRRRRHRHRATGLDISIHALREEGDLALHDALHDIAIISIHALREEGDWTFRRCSKPADYFYPRPPRGGRRRPLEHLCIGCSISIHALREEGDYNTEAVKLLLKEFLSTPSARRATRLLLSGVCKSGHFYPRPPRGGRLPSRCHSQKLFCDFYPRPPRGGRL